MSPKKPNEAVGEPSELESNKDSKSEPTSGLSSQRPAAKIPTAKEPAAKRAAGLPKRLSIRDIDFQPDKLEPSPSQPSDLPMRVVEPRPDLRAGAKDNVARQPPRLPQGRLQPQEWIQYLTQPSLYSSWDSKGFNPDEADQYPYIPPRIGEDKDKDEDDRENPE